MIANNNVAKSPLKQGLRAGKARVGLMNVRDTPRPPGRGARIVDESNTNTVRISGARRTPETSRQL